ncbi:TetR/AcrR family transcriptional regulator [Dyadobacter fanqingshengii]|uniref:TetR/AcrR family transcriptional regulator n=1 Tax=Dyadobacter fanqingshengii TaxID=2906443 RepID=A0A9X1PB20_9BACT|nr:TetR/AcrR family transcriptional regulator [Dyadobacter fanqingshengii]MCF0040949.1 TetR/AcrR family transcriptional regulator [Dyadobacter fanqingshengii]MCF2505948.1 TetR/AcrR family transcriptional regulator [Dyadobacter fanqingshengii]USJ37319.1 TetR/AcrR family transcriptional regulator [Dyadobacter fanqingshengii]
MAIKERKERERQDMRNLIIDSATQLFLKQGYDKTSIRTIAEDIEYSPATIYLYFKDKDEIFYVIHENAFAILDKQFRKHDSIENPFDRLIAVCKTYVKFAMDNPDYYDLMFIMRAPLSQIKSEEKWDAGECAFEYVLDTIAACLEANLIKPMDKYVLAISVWSFGHGLVSLYVRERLSVMEMPDDVMLIMMESSVNFFLENLRV